MAEREYQIGELSKLLGLSVHTLRYYEKEELIIPRKGNRNIRYYSEEDRLWLEFLIHLKETGMSIVDMKTYTQLRKQTDYNPEVLLEILVKHRAEVIEKIESYQKNLAIINEKIAVYAEEADSNLFELFKTEEQEHLRKEESK
ncbi:MerR family transcriptional regulator [Enterococcus sp. LJL90]